MPIIRQTREEKEAIYQEHLKRCKEWEESEPQRIEEEANKRISELTNVFNYLDSETLKKVIVSLCDYQIDFIGIGSTDYGADWELKVLFCIKNKISTL